MNKTKQKGKNTIKNFFKFIILSIFLIIVLFPFIWMLLTSLKGTQGEIYAFPISYLPKSPALTNYISMLWKGNFGRYMINSIMVSVTAAVCSVVIGIMAGYVLSRFKFKLKGPLLMFFLITQMIPTFIMLAPLYQMLSKLHMLNNLGTLALLYINMTIPFSVVTLQSFFAGISPSIEEAAWIDGCSYTKAIYLVIIPIVKPGIAATAIFAFINSWNELFMAIMFIDVDKYKTISVGLNALILKYDIKWGEMTAGIVMALIPTIFLFAFAQKYMIEGLTTGAVKG